MPAKSNRNKMSKLLVLLLVALGFGYANITHKIVQKNNLQVGEAFYSYSNSEYFADADQMFYGPEIVRSVVGKEPFFDRDQEGSIQPLPFLFLKTLSVFIPNLDGFFFYKDLVFSSLIFIGMSLFAFKFTGLFYGAILGSLVVLNPYFNSTLILDGLTLVVSTDPSVKGFLPLTKYPNQFNFILFLGFQYLFFSLLKRSNVKFVDMGLLAAMLIALGYSYFYYFATAFGQLSLLLLLYGCQRRFSNLIAGVGCLVLSLFAMVPVLYLKHTSMFFDDFLLSVYQTKSTNFPVYSYVIKCATLTVVAMFMLIFEPVRKQALFVISLLVPGCFYVLVGYHFVNIPEISHFAFDYALGLKLIFLMIFAFGYKLFSFNNLLKRLPHTVMLSFALLMTVTLVQHQLVLGTVVKPNVFTAAYKEVLTHLNKNLEDDNTVFFFDARLLEMNPIYGGGQNYLTSMRDVTRRPIENVISSVQNATRHLDIEHSFSANIFNNCRGDLVTQNLCAYLFYSYFHVDQASLSFSVYSKHLAKLESLIPNQNMQGNFYISSPLELGFKENILELHMPPPDYVVCTLSDCEKLGERFYANYAVSGRFGDFSVYGRNQ